MNIVCHELKEQPFFQFSVSLVHKDIPEEGAKLVSVYFLFLATCARLVMLIETSWQYQPNSAHAAAHSSREDDVNTPMTVST